MRTCNETCSHVRVEQIQNAILCSHVSELHMYSAVKDTDCRTFSSSPPFLCSKGRSVSCQLYTSHECRIHGIWHTKLRIIITQSHYKTTELHERKCFDVQSWYDFQLSNIQISRPSIKLYHSSVCFIGYRWPQPNLYFFSVASSSFSCELRTRSCPHTAHMLVSRLLLGRPPLLVYWEKQTNKIRVMKKCNRNARSFSPPHYLHAYKQVHIQDRQFILGCQNSGFQDFISILQHFLTPKEVFLRGLLWKLNSWGFWGFGRNVTVLAEVTGE